ncbi:MAG: cation:proton antiporter [Cyanobacteriota bacterium]
MNISDFLYYLVLILFFAKVFGEISQFFGQPPVLGELLAGIILGPGALGLIQDISIFEHNNFFYLLAEVGILLLLFEVGLETDLSELVKVGKKSLIIGITGIILPFTFAFLFCYSIGESTMESIMIGAALTATSIGITSKIFEELKILKSEEAKIVLGAAVVDDILALAILGILSSMATSNQKLDFVFIITSISISILFLVFAIVLGRIFVSHLVKILEKMSSRGIMLIGAITFALLLSLIAKQVGSSIIIGSFAAGILLAETNKKDLIMKGLKPIVDFFTPIFFVSVGIAINLAIFNPFDVQNHSILVLIMILVVIAIITKILPAYFVKFDNNINQKIIGLGMVPRGEVGLIFASMGKITAILTVQMYNVIVAVVVLSTIVVPPLLKYIVKRDKSINNHD